MNEKIRELLNEATSGLDPDLSPQRTVTLNEMEKFALLIVRECMDTISDCSMEYCTRPQIVSEIKEHFGVEE